MGKGLLQDGELESPGRPTSPCVGETCRAPVGWLPPRAQGGGGGLGCARPVVFFGPGGPARLPQAAAPRPRLKRRPSLHRVGARLVPSEQRSALPLWSRLCGDRPRGDLTARPPR